MPKPNLKNRPNLVIIGAMKCGTSSLHYYLNLHPQIQMSSIKELDFFIEEKNWYRGLDWYEKQFIPNNQEVKIYGEASPNYTKYPTFKGVPKKMYQIIPDAKLIYIIRDPIKRIISHYIHNYAIRDINETLEATLSQLEDNHYVNCSCYGMQIDHFLQYYSSSQILILTLEELASEPISALKKIFNFLEVDSSFCHEEFTNVIHKSESKKRSTKFGYAIGKLPAGLRFKKIIPQLMEKEIEEPVMSNQTQYKLKKILSQDLEKLKKVMAHPPFNWE